MWNDSVPHENGMGLQPKVICIHRLYGTRSKANGNAMSRQIFRFICVVILFSRNVCGNTCYSSQWGDCHFMLLFSSKSYPDGKNFEGK